MIALSLATTWLILTGGSFLGLSALGRSELREDFETDRGTNAPEGATLTGSWPTKRGRSPL